MPDPDPRVDRPAGPVVGFWRHHRVASLVRADHSRDGCPRGNPIRFSPLLPSRRSGRPPAIVHGLFPPAEGLPPLGRRGSCTRAADQLVARRRCRMPYDTWDDAGRTTGTSLRSSPLSRVSHGSRLPARERCGPAQPPPRSTTETPALLGGVVAVAAVVLFAFAPPPRVPVGTTIFGSGLPLVRFRRSDGCPGAGSPPCPRGPAGAAARLVHTCGCLPVPVLSVAAAQCDGRPATPSRRPTHVRSAPPRPLLHLAEQRPAAPSPYPHSGTRRPHGPRPRLVPAPRREEEDHPSRTSP